ncbi:PAS domain-containing sensor histidine kinase [Adhaeribacter pallidiroseus]|uniref:Oxygen sensor histidine kinase NreB n=1 Tax=Adhaeribacter pallidiroseus TaxID=2072847 RepID=A0A369Q941_9BACT|nr:PAS domain-containing protein [Adhaeribacter pallidiroseus]RDC58808.1 Signal transduction histidine-protein kinase/phosphatase DegS [Adhaeribacter pallidiroseus]
MTNQTDDVYRLVVENPPAAISRWDRNLQLLFANPAFVGKTGFDLGQLGGKTIREMEQPDAITAPWMEKLQQVWDTGQPAEHHHLFPTPTEQVFWHIYFLPELGPDGQVASVLAIGWDLTDLKKAEWNLPDANQQATERYRALFNSLDAGFCIIEVLFDASGQAFDYRFLETNYSFEKQTGLAQAVGKTMKEMAPAHEQHWFDLYGNIARTGEPARFENAARALGHYYEGYAFRIDAPAEQHVAILFNDVTERKRTEEALRVADARFRLFVTATSEIVYRMSPDWQQMYSLEGKQFLADTRDPSLTWLAEYIPNSDMALVQAAITAAIQSKSTFELEHHVIRVDGSLGWVFSRAVPFLNEHGDIIEWFGTASDITERKRAEEALQITKDRLQALIENLPGGAVFVVNREMRYLVAAGEALITAGFTPQDLVGHTVAEAMPPEMATVYEQKYQQALAGKPFEHEHMAHGRVFISRGVPLSDSTGVNSSVITISYDITERKQAEEKLKQFSELLEQQVVERTQALSESRDLLQSVFDTTLLSFSVLKAVRDEKGALTDFKIVLVNKELARETGRPDLVGKLYSVEFPGIKPAGLYDLMLRVVETGEPDQVEYYYPHEGFNKWYAAMFVKMDDGLVASNLDITERKLAEAELTRNLTILKQAEEVAGMGSWEYDYITGQFYWSEGMYHLFGLPVDREKSPEIYLEYVLAEDRAIAEKLVDTIKNHPQALEETLRIRVKEQVITLQVKTIVLRDDLERPYKMMGVDLDVSQLKNLEQENLVMRLEQQKALLLAIMDVQQEERKRISEALHNGVGQILYATKLNLDQIAEQVSKEMIAPTAKLLSAAIQETRRVSHELVPMVLQDFGLTRAMEELCRNYIPSTLTVNCEVDLEERLASYLELAIYRIAQELLTNVAKHAQATEVDLLLMQEDGQITLKVRDNGQGLSSENGKKKGLGLRTIADRVKLLNGTFILTASPSGKGILVVIQLPVPA